jgi:hypothetical protein
MTPYVHNTDNNVYASPTTWFFCCIFFGNDVYMFKDSRPPSVTEFSGMGDL